MISLEGREIEKLIQSPQFFTQIFESVNNSSNLYAIHASTRASNFFLTPHSVVYKFTRPYITLVKARPLVRYVIALCLGHNIVKLQFCT